MSGKQKPKEPVKKEPVIHAGGRELRFLFDVQACARSKKSSEACKA